MKRELTNAKALAANSNILIMDEPTTSLTSSEVSHLFDTVKQLKNCLSVYPCVQGGVAEESQYHISTEFVVEYHASKHTDHLDAENVITLITSAYKEYYI